MFKPNPSLNPSLIFFWTSSSSKGLITLISGSSSGAGAGDGGLLLVGADGPGAGGVGGVQGLGGEVEEVVKVHVPYFHRLVSYMVRII